MIVGGYVMHLYCRYKETHDWHTNQQRFEYGGRNKREAEKEARAAGWKFSDGDVTCPYCIPETTDKPAAAHQPTDTQPTQD